MVSVALTDMKNFLLESTAESGDKTENIHLNII